VTVEVEAYRPFFILGEVKRPGQFPLRQCHDGRDGSGHRRRLHRAGQ
jgi:protein involved in polysaccharide export with SLBB domain